MDTGFSKGVVTMPLAEASDDRLVKEWELEIRGRHYILRLWRDSPGDWRYGIGGTGRLRDLDLLLWFARWQLEFFH